MKLEAILQEMRDSGINFDLLEHGSVLRCSDVKKELGVPMERIVKTIILKSDQGFFGFVTLADSKVDLRLLEKITGMKFSLCPRELVEKVTGQELGGISPLLLEIDIILDGRIAKDEILFCGTGSRTGSIAIRGKDLFNFLLSKKRCIVINFWR